MHTSSSSSIILPCAFWTIIELLQQPQLGKQVTAGISQHYLPQSGEYDITSIMDTPLIQSMHTEVRRLRMPTVTTRTNEVDNLQLDEQWRLPKGITVVIFSRDISLHTDFWAKARPRTIERPLEEFWAERFLVPSRAAPSAKREKQSKDTTFNSATFSMEGLEPLDLVLDDDSDGRCLGREYSRAVQAATLAVFSTQFELQLCEPESVAAGLSLPVHEAAFGAVKPLNEVAMRIRKRKI